MLVSKKCFRWMTSLLEKIRTLLCEKIIREKLIIIYSMRNQN